MKRDEYLQDLLEQLNKYGESDFYPFHMPGHKRTKIKEFSPLPFQMDITEIEGFDDLHCPQGILRERMAYGAEVFGCDQCFYLVNGSSGGILSAISAVTEYGDEVIVARNCHKSVYHTIFLRGLRAHYLYPEVFLPWGINKGISIEEIQQSIQKYPEAKCVILVSPTYDGIASDIIGISEICHQYGKILIVDEAHGAHFGFHSAFPDSAIHQGADLVINSVHKTLPSLTQTAVLKYQDHHMGVDLERLRGYLGIYQSSSPSYVLMASIDRCLRFMDQQGEEYLGQYVDNLNTFYNQGGETENLALLDFREQREIPWDFGKIILSASKYNLSHKERISGPWMEAILRKKYHLEMEMAPGDYVLAMTSLMDTREGFDRLQKAVREMDQTVGQWEKLTVGEEKNSFLQSILRGEQEGCSAKEYIYAYPPGIPLIVPGEIYGRDLIEQLQRLILDHVNIQVVKAF